ncbi:glycosyltransferase 87 family protein [Kribbella sp. NPDC023855]|uniref:glycosyltransferase 87 family protein n=1 Tax=Kribbella sp. NPDC023855 TaxID=3154698 RepID=UPI0033E8758F
MTRRFVVPVAALLALTPFLYVVYAGSLDLKVYRTGGYAWLHGISLYSEHFADLVPGIRLPFTYPPLAAILFVGLDVLPLTIAELFMNLASVTALTATALVVAWRLFGWNQRALLAGLVVSAGAMVLEPVRSTIGFGQVNLILMGLVALDCLLPKTRWPRGLLLGLAIAIKLTPAVFIPYFLVRRQFRPALVAFASFAGFSLAAWALAPADSAKYWFGVLFDPGRIGGATYAFNQCYQAVLHRVMTDGPGRSLLWLALVAATGVLAAVAARRARAEGDDVRALLAIAVWGLLASPVSWSHHWVWVLPATLYLWKRSRWMLLATIPFVVGPHTLLDPEGRHWSLPEHLIGSSYVLLGLVFLMVATRRGPRTGPGYQQAGRGLGAGGASGVAASGPETPRG